MRWFLILLFLAGNLRGSPDSEHAKWIVTQTKPADSILLDRLVARYERTQNIYRAIEAMVPNGVPAEVVFCLLYREADNDMTCSPAQGDPLTHRSIHVPKGRIPGVNPPYTFLQAANDAYYSPDLDHLQTKEWSQIGDVLWNCEGFNGLGYSRRGVPSPYIWSGTNQYTRGKYTGDGRYDPLFVDRQMGVASILKRMQYRGIP